MSSSSIPQISFCTSALLRSLVILLYLDRLWRDDFIESYVERFELSLNRFIQEPINIEIDELFFVLICNSNMRSSFFEFYYLFHAKVVIAGAEREVH